MQLRVRATHLDQVQGATILERVTADVYPELPQSGVFQLAADGPWAPIQGNRWGADGTPTVILDPIDEVSSGVTLADIENLGFAAL